MVNLLVKTRLRLDQTDIRCYHLKFFLVQGRRIIVTHQNQPQQCSHCFGYSNPKYGDGLDLCPGNKNGCACKVLGTERAKMGPYMHELERLHGYRSLKAKFSNVSNMEEENEDVYNKPPYSRPPPLTLFFFPLEHHYL